VQKRPQPTVVALLGKRVMQKTTTTRRHGCKQ